MIILLTMQLALASVTPAEPPRTGREVWVHVANEDTPLAGETVRVLHRPGLHGETEIAIGITDSRGRVRWQPSKAGVAELRAGSETQRVVVMSRPPTGTSVLLTLLVLLGAGALAIGSRARTWRRE